MENISSKKIIYQYGLLTSLISIAWQMVRISTDTHYEDDTISFMMGILIILSGVVLAQLAYRKSNGGYIEYGKCLKIGVGVGAILALTGAIFNLIFTNVIEVDYYDKVIEIGYNKAMQDDPEMLQGATLQQVKEYWGWLPKLAPAIIIGFTLFFSFLLSLCSGIIIKRNAE